MSSEGTLVPQASGPQARHRVLGGSSGAVLSSLRHGSVLRSNSSTSASASSTTTDPTSMKTSPIPFHARSSSPAIIPVPTSPAHPPNASSSTSSSSSTSADIDVNPPSQSPTAAASNAAVMDQFLDDAGGVGQYQRLSVAWLSLVVWPSLGLNVMGLVFIMQGAASDFPDAQVSLLPTSMFAGWMCASFVINRLADAHGRKPVVFGTLFGLAVCSFFRALATSFPILVALHFPIGAFIGGAGSVSYVLVMETLPAHFKSTATSIKAAGYASAGAASAWVAMRYPFWRHMCLVSSLPPGVALITYLFILESPRFYLSRGYLKSARHTLALIADTNGYPKATACLSRLVVPSVAGGGGGGGGAAVSDSSPLDGSSSSGSSRNGGGRGGSPQGTSGVSQIFSNPRLLAQASILWFAWFACSLSYYGLGFMAGNLGDIHYTTVLLNVIELPAAFLASSLVKHIGKKTVLGLSTGGAGLCLMVLASGQAGPLQQYLALAGKFCVCAAWIPAYVLATDVFPTAIRGTGIGLCNTTARFGAMISPLLVAKLSASTCLVVFAGAGLAAGFLVFRLPEALPAALVKASTASNDALGAIKPVTRMLSV